MYYEDEAGEFWTREALEHRAVDLSIWLDRTISVQESDGFLYLADEQFTSTDYVGYSDTLHR